MGKKLTGWKEKLLSMGGREILIKAVAQAIPTYTMSCFQLPKGLCDDLEGMMRRFGWGQNNKNKRLLGSIGKRCVNQNLEGGWDFKICRLST